MDAASSAAIDTGRAAMASRARPAASPAASAFAALIAPLMAATTESQPNANGGSTTTFDVDAAPDGQTTGAGKTFGAATTADATSADAGAQSVDLPGSLATLLAAQVGAMGDGAATPPGMTAAQHEPVATPDGATPPGLMTAPGQTSQAQPRAENEAGRQRGVDKAPGTPSPAASPIAVAATQAKGAQDQAAVDAGAADGAAATGVDGQTQSGAPAAAAQSAPAPQTTQQQMAALDPARLSEIARAAMPDQRGEPAARPAPGGTASTRAAKSGESGAGKLDGAATAPDAPLRQLRAGPDETSASAPVTPAPQTSAEASGGQHHKDAMAPQTAAAPTSGAPSSANAAAATAALAPSPMTADGGGDASLLGAPQGAAAPAGAPAASAASPPAHGLHGMVDRGAAAAGQVASQIVRRFDGRTTSFEVRLDPAELGRVDVRIEVGADRKVRASVAAENASTLADLVRASRDLERALSDAGLDLSESGLSFNLAGDGGAAFADARANAQGQDLPARAARGDAAEAAAVTEPQRRAAPLSLSRWSGARLDVWA